MTKQVTKYRKIAPTPAPKDVYRELFNCLNPNDNTDVKTKSKN